MEKWSMRKEFIRSLLHISSLTYIILLFYLVIKQQNFIENILQKHFKINIENLLLFFSTEDWMQLLKEKIRDVGIELIIFIIIQLLLLILGLILISWLAWKLKRIDQWYLAEKFLIIGYLFLTLSTVIILTKMYFVTNETYQTIFQRINDLSLTEVRAFQDKISSNFSNIHFTLDSIISDTLFLVDQLRDTINKTQRIVDIPELLHQSWQKMILLKNWMLGCCISGLAIILTSHGIFVIHLIKTSNYVQGKIQKSRFSRQIELNEKLVKLMSQQQILLEEIIKKK